MDRKFFVFSLFMILAVVGFGEDVRAETLGEVPPVVGLPPVPETTPTTQPTAPAPETMPETAVMAETLPVVAPIATPPAPVQPPAKIIKKTVVKRIPIGWTEHQSLKVLVIVLGTGLIVGLILGLLFGKLIFKGKTDSET